jgi:LPS O-antigen subunit length determinant protein (WzzB/FepE family)
MNKIEELKNELQDRIETLEAVIKIADELKITMTEKEIAERV